MTAQNREPRARAVPFACEPGEVAGARVLVVDDQRNLRTTLALMLRNAGYVVDEAADGSTAIEMGVRGAYDIVVTDLRIGESDGIDVLRALKARQPLTEVLVMTAFGTIESAVEALRLGAFDYIQKPLSEPELCVKVARAIESRRLHGQVRLFAEEFRERYRLTSLVGRSPSMRDVVARVMKLAPTSATTLITGESGTGKELVARAIHANSARVERPFVTVNCAAVSETLLESELFGHARGAFTGAVSARKGLLEEADGGTIFFDEIAETTPAFQAKLLRVLQEGEFRRVGENRRIEVDVRIVAATNLDLTQAVAERRFRQDLFYRLNVARLHVPPLRARREDIPALVEHFLARHASALGVSVRLDHGVLARLVSHDYPGNVRELENMLEQAVALCSNGIVSLDDLPEDVAFGQRAQRSGPTLADYVRDAERSAIEQALIASDGSRERAAALLQVSSATLWRKMTRLGISGDLRRRRSLQALSSRSTHVGPL